ncbi:MAG TPA: flavin reductase family protein [Mycobacteriales bacterium]|nr:flavin reductase family protein [Mycobacteriales bacterium]
MAVDPIEYRRVVGRFATGVTVVTAVVDGEQHAMTCSSFTSVSLHPVLVLFCAEKVARFHDAALAAGQWAVSVLAVGQGDLSRRFAVRGRPLEDQFCDVPHARGALTGAAVVDGAVAALECRTVSTVDAGDHTVFVGEVLGVSVPDTAGEPLLYYEGRYRGLAPR